MLVGPVLLDAKGKMIWNNFDLLSDNHDFPDPVYHMFDFMGTGAEEVITLSRGKLRVYGSRLAGHSNVDRKQDPDYLKSKVVNHTHY